MELQWPLILFTTLVAWSAGLFGAQGVAALSGAGKKSQMPALITSIVLLAASGIAVFFHLEHWERIFNGFGHITSGITQELIAIVVFAVVAVVYFVMLRKSEDGGTVPAWCAWLAIIIAVVLAAVCAHSYMMSARPAWDSVLEVMSIVGVSCILGPGTMAAIMAILGDDAQPMAMPVLVGAAICAVCTVAYAIFLQASGGSFTDVGYYFDPTSPTAGMTDADAEVSSELPLLWGGAVVVGAALPLVCAFLGRKQGGASWKVWGSAATACALVGAVCLRVVFYNMGLSVFMFY